MGDGFGGLERVCYNLGRGKITMNLEFELPDEKEDAFYPTSVGVLRQIIYRRDDGICRVCRARVEFENYQLSHIVDRSRGGQLVASNLIVCCWLCNNIKPKHNTKSEFVEWMKSGAWISAFAAHAKTKGLDIDEGYILANAGVIANTRWNVKAERASDEQEVEEKTPKKGKKKK